MNKALFFKALALASVVLLSACERPPMDSVQRGYRGTGMVQVYNPRTIEQNEELHAAPVALPPASADGPKAGKVYQNVKVLGDLSVAQFTQLMVNMTSWVAPTEGCAYCHNPANFAEEGKYTKVVARRMIEMTQHINSGWKNHVAETGVTCYTCHRGQPVPSQIWFKEPPQANGADFIGGRAGQNLAAKSVGLSSLPSDPFTPFLLDLWFDDPHVHCLGGQLHLLPQLAFVLQLGGEPAAAGHSMAWHPHGARAQPQLPRAPHSHLPQPAQG